MSKEGRRLIYAVFLTACLMAIGMPLAIWAIARLVHWLGLGG